MQRNLNHMFKVQLDFVMPQRIEESVERLWYLGFEVFNNRYDLVNALLTHQTDWSVDEQMNVFVKLYVRRKLYSVHFMMSLQGRVVSMFHIFSASSSTGTPSHCAACSRSWNTWTL